MMLAIMSGDKRTTALYVGFFVGCGFMYKIWHPTAATGDNDWMLSLSAALQALAFVMLVKESEGSVGEGLSEKTLWALLLAQMTRISTTFWGEGYVPEDNTADVYLYQMLELSAVVLNGYQILRISSLRTIHDSGAEDRWTALGGMVLASGVLAYVTKSTGHGDYFADLSWMFSVWLEAFALVPQVMMLTAASIVDSSVAHFAGLTLASSVAWAVCWFQSHWGAYERLSANGSYFWWGIMGTSALRVLLCSVYVYLFIKAHRDGKGSGQAFGGRNCLDEEML